MLWASLKKIVQLSVYTESNQDAVYFYFFEKKKNTVSKNIQMSSKLWLTLWNYRFKFTFHMQNIYTL